MAASKGALPRFSREQLVPPAAVLCNENPKLAVERTVVVPPELHVQLPHTGPLGDPLSSVLGPPSNGTGSGGGIGPAVVVGLVQAVDRASARDGELESEAATIAWAVASQRPA